MTVTIEPLSGRDAYGAPVFGAAVTYKAMVTYISKSYRSKDGQVFDADTVSWLNTGDPISPEDRLTLPDGTQPPLVKVERYVDDLGHVVVVKLYC